VIIRSTALALPLRDACVDLIVTSPPYFALRSYRDGDEHYAGQLGSEETPAAFVDALIEATREMVRVLKPTGSIFVNLGDKYAGSGGHNNNGLGKSGFINSKKYLDGRSDQGFQATRRNAPDRYNQNSGGIPAKSLMGLPWRYANAVVDRLELILRAEIVWDKPSGMPESVTDRVRRSHEQWFHFTKQGRYFSAIDELREPHRSKPQRRLTPQNGKARGYPGNPQTLRTDYSEELHIARAHPLGSIPGSVWTITTEPLTIPDWAREKYNLPDHFAAFPQEWPRRLILGWCPPDGVVLDPFGGTGTVAMVARALGRTGLNGDLSSDYCRLARWRIYESGHAAKSEDRTWRDAQGAML
jgi:DNA modification methylase